MKDPYQIIHSRYITEKCTVLEGLQAMDSNPCVARCKAPKYVFLVKKEANKSEIKTAIESIYRERSVKVAKVNTVLMKPKIRNKGRRRGRVGATSTIKKAVVTLEPGDTLDNV